MTGWFRWLFGVRDEVKVRQLAREVAFEMNRRRSENPRHLMHGRDFDNDTPCLDCRCVAGEHGALFGAFARCHSCGKCEEYIPDSAHWARATKQARRNRPAVPRITESSRPTDGQSARSSPADAGSQEHL